MSQEFIIPLITYDETHGITLFNALSPVVKDQTDDVLRHVTDLRLNEPCVWSWHVLNLSRLMEGPYGSVDAAIRAQQHTENIREAGAIAIGAVIGNPELQTPEDFIGLKDFLFQARIDTWMGAVTLRPPRYHILR